MRYLIRLFYVEHLQHRIILVILIMSAALALPACKKKLDPNPELRDPVLSALNAELAIAKADLAAKESEIKAIQNDLKNAVPQSGEIRVFERRLNDAQESKAHSEQKVRYFEIKVEQQKLVARRLYLESQLPDRKPWPSDEFTKQGLEVVSQFRDRQARMTKEAPVPRGTNEAKKPETKDKPATTTQDNKKDGH